MHRAATPVSPLLVLATSVFIASCVPPAEAPISSGALQAAFADAEATTGVPADVLSAAAWVSSHWVHRPAPAPGGVGIPTWGVMALHDDWPRYDLSRGAVLAGVATEDAALEPALNILAAAHLIVDRAKDLYEPVPATTELAAWIAVTADVLGNRNGVAVAALREDMTYALLTGVTRTLADGETVTLEPRPVPTPDGISSISSALAEYPVAVWAPADPSNYSTTRNSAIDMVVIHTIQGSYAGAISWFGNPASNVSAHFVIRSSDGEVTQSVLEEHRAWHAGESATNHRSIGLEHEGFVDDASYLTTALYAGSAALTAYLANKYSFPADRAHVIGHYEVPGCPNPLGGGNSCHTDPGPLWDWDYYMSLVNAPGLPEWEASMTTMSFPAVMIAGEERIAWVEFANDGSRGWSENTRLGTSNPRDRDSPFYHPGNWLSPTRPSSVDVPVGYGNLGRFSFVLQAPAVAEPTVFVEYFNLVEENVDWFGPCDDCLALEILVLPPGWEDPIPDPVDPIDPDPIDPPGMGGGCSVAPPVSSEDTGSGAFAALALLGIAFLRRRVQRRE